MHCNAIKSGAIFIADAHENGENRKDFKRFLQQIESKQIKTEQLFLMGDMFDFLAGGVKYAMEKYKNEIEIIEKIAQNIEVFYFEGNHDFNLQKVFRHAKTLSIKGQPLLFLNSDLKIVLSHGDLFGGFWYGVYTKFIRSPLTLFLGNLIDINGWISRKILQSQHSKKLCRAIDNFEQKITAKIERYKEGDFIVEGHYHQNKTFSVKDKKYTNFASFACKKVYYVFDDLKFKEVHFKTTLI